MKYFLKTGIWADDPYYMDGGIVQLVVLGTIDGEPAHFGVAFGFPKQSPHTEWYHL